MARRHHNKKRAEGFIPNQHGQDNTNNNTTGDTPNGGNNNAGSSSAAASSSTTPSSSAAPSRTTTTTTTTTTPAAAQTTTSTTPSTTSTTTTTTSSTPITTSSTTTPIVVQNTLSVNQIPTTATNLISHSVATPTIGSATFSSASASATAAANDSGPQIGPLVGAIGGGLIGVVALAAVAGYFFRRAFRKKDEFNRADFVRNSVAITDDWNEKPPMGSQNAMALARANNNMDEPSATPRPPTMIERRGQAQPSYGVGEVMNTGYYGQQDQYYNYGNNGYYGHDQYAAGYDQQYATGEHPYAAGAAYGYTPPNEYQQSQLTRKPSAPLGTARGAGSEQQQQQQGHDNVASPAGDYSTPSQYDARQSVTPFQQQQYNEINKALNGGTTPTATAPAGGRELSTAYSTLNQPAQGQQQHAPTGAHQPAANNRKSVYDDEEDAYGGI